MKITCVGIDAAFANMGFALVEIDFDARGEVREVACDDLRLVSTEAQDKKVVRKSSDDLRRAKELHAEITRYCKGAAFAFVEVPSGSQNASAARSLGIAVGVLAACPCEIIEVNPMEVKLAVSGDKKVNPTKPQMIAWATKRWPHAPWLTRRSKGKQELTLANEHLADALASVMAGIATPEFKRLIQLMQHHEASRPIDQRPASRRRAQL